MSNRIWLAVGIGAGLLTMAFVAVLRAPERPDPLPEYWSAPAFRLMDQTGAPLGQDDLLGSVWVASFVFTSCTDVCPGISARMARLADDFRRERVLGESVRLVSITVDPERDTPAALRDYADGFGGLPPSKWAFLTGAPGDSVRALIQHGFHLTAMKPEPSHDAHVAGAESAGGGYEVMHSPRVLLVDQAGTIRGIYDATDAESMSAIAVDALRLLDS